MPSPIIKNSVRAISLKTKVLLAVSLSMLAAIVCLVAQVSALVQADREQMVSDHLRSSLAYVAADLDRKIALRRSTMNESAASLAREPGMRQGAEEDAWLASDAALFAGIDKSRFGRTGFVVVLSPHNRQIIWSSDPALNAERLPARGVSTLLDQRLDDKSEGVATVVHALGIESIAVAKVLASTGWIAVASVGTEEAFAPATALKLRIYGAALLVALALVPILYLVLRRQFAPLRDTAAALRRMTDGVVPLAQLPVKRDDEIGEVVGSVNRLLLERKRAEDSIHELNRNLEHRVEERTSELIAANETLANSIEKLKSAESAALDYSVRLQAMTRRYIGAQESERRKLAREVHDRVSSSLTAIGLNLGLIDCRLGDNTPAPLKARLADTVALVTDTIANARDISCNLHPAALDYVGVLPALEDYGRNYSARTGIRVEVSGTADELRLSPEREMALYRVAQEALNNSARHAEARKVTIELNGDAEHVLLTISDDGAGFGANALTPLETLKSPSLGLLSMKERAEAIGASFRIESMPTQGTKVIVDLQQGLHLA